MRAHRIPAFITSPQRRLQETSAPTQVAAFIALLKNPFQLDSGTVAPAAPDGGETSRAQAPQAGA